MLKRLFVLAALLLVPAILRAQPIDVAGRPIVNVGGTGAGALSATNPLAVRPTDGSAFVVPALDTTLTARFPAGSTPGDNESNAVAITRSGAFVFVWDGATWDRWTGAVSGTVAATQSGAWNVGTLTSITNPVAVTGTFWQATQPVSGTVAATQSGAWTAQPGNTPNTVPWLASIHDGTTRAAVLNLAANDPLSVAIVDGAGSQITSFGGGTQYTEADTDASVTGTAVMWEDAADTLRVASAAKPLPVNVVAGGAGDGSILDGVSAAIKATVLDYTNSNPLAVRLTDTGGDYVGAGAGTQYADGAVQATPTGTVALGHDGANVRAITTDAAGDLQVDVVTMPAITGTVTANAGTGTMAVSGPLTDTQLRATAVPVSGAFWQATQPVSAASLPLPTGAATEATLGGVLTTTAHDAAFGTAGLADAQVRSIQGVAGGTAVPVSGAFYQGTQPVSIATMPSTPVTGTFWQATQPVSVAAAVTVAQATAANLNATVTDGVGALNVIVDSGAVTVSGTVTANAGTGTLAVSGPLTDTQLRATAVPVSGTVTVVQSNEGQQTAANSISVTLDTDNDFVAADAASPPTGRAAIGGLTSGATGGLMESVTVCDSFANVSVTTATTTLLITGVSGRHVRICSLSLVTALANNVALISGTGATCGTGTTGMTGGTTAPTGWNFAANGGIAQGSGIGTINQTNATGDSVCVITSAATQLSGRIAYAIY